MKTPAAMLAGLVASAFSLSVAAQQLPKTELNVVGNLGITTMYKLQELPFWTKTIPERSGGAVTAQIKPWNELGMKGPEVFRLLQQGLYTIATAQMGHMAGDAPINDATDIAGLSPTIETFKQVTEAFRPALSKFYEDKLQLRLLGLWSFQAQVLYCRDPISNLRDLKGRKVRTSGASQSDFVEHFGGSGVPVAFGEVHQALQKGVIDCAITGTLGGYSAKWYEGAKYLYPLPINWGSSANAANLKAWNGLDPAVRDFLQKNIKELEAAIWAQNKRENDVGIACNTGGQCPLGKAADMALVPVAAEDEGLRREALLQTVLPRWAKRCGAECATQWNETVGKLANLEAPVQ
ncbi:MAG: TRAP transporter substrate-binding protein [Burkholderiales bacterium]|nr:MAG: TRAP transporter substrate-binding protein [Burkholderiales bacterium]